MKRISIALLCILCFSLLACEQEATQEMPYDVLSLPVLTEAFHTERDEGENVDSPAIWHGENGENWLLATAKEGHTINVYNAENGTLIKRYGQQGQGAGEFNRPNGIAVIDNLMLVVERDNARVQLTRLPDMEHIGIISHEDLRYPYGLTIEQINGQDYELFVTDNYNPAAEGYPLEDQLDERIHHYRFSIGNQGEFSYETINIFGDIQGEGVLHKVESLFIDPLYDRLLIADEANARRNIKIYNLDGHFTGEVIPEIYFTSEPEGIALYSCEDGSGYWIIVDQHKTEENKFQVFDRETLAYRGGFRAEITRNTDGIWLTQKAFGPFPEGALYPVHDDGSVTAISWADISNALTLERNCTL